MSLFYAIRVSFSTQAYRSFELQLSINPNKSHLHLGARTIPEIYLNLVIMLYEQLRLRVHQRSERVRLKLHTFVLLVN